MCNSPSASDIFCLNQRFAPTTGPSSLYKLHMRNAGQVNLPVIFHRMEKWGRFRRTAKA